MFERRALGRSALIGSLKQGHHREVFTERRREGGPQRTCKGKKQEVLEAALNSTS